MPAPEVLSRGGALARSLVGSPVFVCWPRHGWCLGHVTGLPRRGTTCASGSGAEANFTVAYCDDPDRPGVATATDHHLLSAELYGLSDEAADWSWVLLAPPAGDTESVTGVRGCGWPGCPGYSCRFAPDQLLRHAREAHGGDLDDARMAWACGVRCATCSMPFAASSLTSHLRAGPDGVRRCPSVARLAEAPGVTVTPADEAFVRGLTADEVYIYLVGPFAAAAEHVRGARAR